MQEEQQDLEESLGFAQIYNGGFFNKKVKILDSTLREGEQAPGYCFYQKTEASNRMDAGLFRSKLYRNFSYSIRISF